MRSSQGRLRLLSIFCCAMAAVAMAAASAQAAVYPSGGSGFSGGPEGWGNPQPAACNLPLGGVCTANAGYDGANGNPAGSLALDTSILVNLGGLFKSTGVFQSPDFVANEGGSATLSLERQLASGNLLDLAPQATVTVSLIDRTSGLTSTVIEDSVTSAETAFVGKSGAAKVTAGHTYAIAINAETSSTLANVGVLGATSLRFDNVALSVGTSGGGGGGGGGGGSLTNQQLQQLLSGNGSLIGPAILKGNMLSVKVRCPKKVGRTCKVALVGLLKKGKPATKVRKAAIRKGKTKKLVLKVKPKALPKVKARKKLLFKETVKAGKARAVVFKRLKLIKR